MASLSVRLAFPKGGVVWAVLSSVAWTHIGIWLGPWCLSPDRQEVTSLQSLCCLHAGPLLGQSGWFFLSTLSVWFVSWNFIFPFPSCSRLST